MPKFTPHQQEVYDLHLSTPPASRTSGGPAAAYFRGLEHPNRPSGCHRGSLAYAAWAAGREAALKIVVDSCSEMADNNWTGALRPAHKGTI